MLVLVLVLGRVRGGEAIDGSVCLEDDGRVMMVGSRGGVGSFSGRCRLEQEDLHSQTAAPMGLSKLKVVDTYIF